MIDTIIERNNDAGNSMSVLPLANEKFVQPGENDGNFTQKRDS